MVRNTIISATKANNFFWLGRYEERVYITLHLLRKCYDKMIDGKKEEYWPLWETLDALGVYQTSEDFTLGMLYDKDNVNSVMYAQMKAMDNAILLREDIMSETLSYLEMSMALIRKCSETLEQNVMNLQPIIDWSLAFWGSSEQRLKNHHALFIMMMGRNIENLDMLIRFDYSYDRVSLAYDSLKRYADQMSHIIDENAENQLNVLLIRERFNLSDTAYKNKLLASINQLVRV